VSERKEQARRESENVATLAQERGLSGGQMAERVYYQRLRAHNERVAPTFSPGPGESRTGTRGYMHRIYGDEELLKRLERRR
jgi:hypothetical protein